MNPILLIAQAAPTTGQQTPSLFGADTILFFLFIGVMFYFIILRPQKREMAERQAALESLKKGDAVVTTGGLHGTIAEIDKEVGTILLQVDRNTRLKFNKSAVNPAPKPAEAKPAEAKK
ncbi:MAG: preprotein translocase subunit YajC [Candidatus Sumerlaeia bacterium]|nr:preprotein translocase subunit YajC [Candidatus Sumerlaeia bacterium]